VLGLAFPNELGSGFRQSDARVQIWQQILHVKGATKRLSQFRNSPRTGEIACMRPDQCVTAKVTGQYPFKLSLVTRPQAHQGVGLPD